MSYSGETEPLMAYAPTPQRRPGLSRLRFFLAVALCFVLLTGSWHAYSWVSRTNRNSIGWRHCHGPWVTHTGSWSLPPHGGVAVTHRRHGKGSRVTHKEHVNIEGTSDNKIAVTVGVKATSNLVASAIEMSLHGNELIIDDYDDQYAGPHDCVELDISIQIPSKVIMPSLNLSLVQSEVHFMESMTAEIHYIDISTFAGTIVSHSSLLTNMASISTRAGTIRGRYTLGEKLSLTSTAGGIDVDVLVNTNISSPKARLLTRSSAGSTQVNLLSPLKHRNQITAQHRSSAGSMTLVYPQEWEGVVEAKTSAGSLRLSGEGLEIVESRGEFGPNRYEKGVKGDDWENKCKVDIYSSAGSCSFTLE